MITRRNEDAQLKRKLRKFSPDMNLRYRHFHADDDELHQGVFLLDPCQESENYKGIFPSRWNFSKEGGEGASLQLFRSNSIKKEVSIALSASNEIETANIRILLLSTANWY
ncbi:hypothetical protein HNY73_011841 [Argiope bruennichi]|uniref:Uncharacterized protein n=1 Tax=Argiope bruennichi TaxID=94029 RepID=A0A8T0ETN6_ARGBR|nr:hypothetical protein HNY73_011841 [Argiope bruennichi]